MVMVKKPSSSSSPSPCVCTFVTQISLCFALYIAFNIGQPQNHSIYNNNGIQRRPLDMYFISVVGGGFRTLQQHTLLVKQMKKVMRMYDVKFVISIGETEEEDRHLKNATSYFQSLEIPWYIATRSLKGEGTDYYHKNIEIPLGRTLDVFSVDTGLFEDPSSGARNNQSQWLEKTLSESNSDWRIAVGYHSLINCTTNSEQSFEFVEPLHRILMTYGVDAYISGQACHNYHPKEGAVEFDSGILVNKGPYLTSVNHKILQIRENASGFLLHRLSPLEFASYFVTLKGEVVSRIALQPRGREFM